MTNPLERQMIPCHECKGIGTKPGIAFRDGEWVKIDVQCPFCNGTKEGLESDPAYIARLQDEILALRKERDNLSDKLEQAERDRLFNLALKEEPCQS